MNQVGGGQRNNPKKRRGEPMEMAGGVGFILRQNFDFRRRGSSVLDLE